jgi:hypothetical protein
MEENCCIMQRGKPYGQTLGCVLKMNHTEGSISMRFMRS